MHITCIYFVLVRKLTTDRLFIAGNSTDTLELATDTIEYELPEPHIMSKNKCLLSDKHCFKGNCMSLSGL